MTKSDDDEVLEFNGINGETGEPLFPPTTSAELAKLVLAEIIDPETLAELAAKAEERAAAHFAPTAFTDPCELSETGWGVLFAYDEDPRVIEALRPLLEHRKQKTGDRLYYEYSREKGYRPNDDKFAFLKRIGVFLQGQVDPEKAPYYLLIVGSPQKIPYAFQFDMDTEFAVGRLSFDTPEEYAQYARSVVEAELGRSVREPAATFFAVKNERDNATPISVEYLIKPLVGFAEDRARKSKTAWEIRAVLEDEATKPRLAKILGGPETPALVFTASHGDGFTNGHERQLAEQGALICSEWSKGTPVPPEHHFAAADVADDADVHGIIAVLFACFGAGTPQRTTFRTGGFVEGPGHEIAPHDFVASLPRRLLAHPKGGALAVIGHVDTALSKSFMWSITGSAQLSEYKSLVGQLMKGVPVGHAMDGFGARYGVLEVQLGRYREDARFGGSPPSRDVSAVWSAKVDARAFVILGDPAVRLNVRGAG